MAIYSNGPQVLLELLELDLSVPPVTAPLIRQIKTARSGARLYTYRPDSRDWCVDPTGADLLFVTPGGHWYRGDDEPDVSRPMPCRGCGVSGATYDELDDQCRCPHPPTAQDISDALMGRTAVNA
ncbi:MAG: hypothetical protein ACRDVE_04380 [Actinocrinis sp.]